LPTACDAVVFAKKVITFTCTRREYNTPRLLFQQYFFVNHNTIVNLTFLLTEPRAQWHAVPA